MTSAVSPSAIPGDTQLVVVPSVVQVAASCLPSLLRVTNAAPVVSTAFFAASPHRRLADDLPFVWPDRSSYESSSTTPAFASSAVIHGLVPASASSNAAKPVFVPAALPDPDPAAEPEPAALPALPSAATFEPAGSTAEPVPVATTGDPEPGSCVVSADFFLHAIVESRQTATIRCSFIATDSSRSELMNRQRRLGIGGNRRVHRHRGNGNDRFRLAGLLRVLRDRRRGEATEILLDVMRELGRELARRLRGELVELDLLVPLVRRLRRVDRAARREHEEAGLDVEHARLDVAVDFLLLSRQEQRADAGDVAPRPRT